jgi:hypothetical protein
MNQRKAVALLRFLYPFWALVGMFGLLYVPSQVTAQTISTHELLFRTSIATNLITQLFFIIIPLLLYMLFEKVDKKLAILMVAFALVSVPIAMICELTNIGALLVKGSPDQVKFFLDLHKQGIVIAQIFWGLWLFPLGILVKNSGYFPKFIGWAVVIGGIGYTLDSFSTLIVPGLVALSPVFQFMTMGEILFILWLIFKGVKLPKI